MSTRKFTRRKTQLDDAQRKVAADELQELPSADLASIELKSLKLDEQYDADCDPYNRTGQHYVEALRRKHD